MAAPTRAASSAMPSARSSAHCTGRSAGAARPTVREWAGPPMALMSRRVSAARLGGLGGAAHGFDVREVRRGRLAADVPGRCPLPPEVAALDEEVRGDHDV